MKLSTNFVKDYVDIPVDYHTLADDMTNVGNEYDSAEKLINATHLVIGEILECEMHPDSDHLHICKVNVGNEVLQIVCGAPNARVGIKVVVALVGAELPGDFKIKKSKIRGVDSFGMMCSLEELGIEHKFLRPQDTEGIIELGADAVPGEDPIKYLKLDDEVIDFELTANRGDLLSILGMAHEIGAIYDKEVKEIDLSHSEGPNHIDGTFHLDIETSNCSLFLAKRVNNVVIKESPEWLRNRLIASGIRPINNVVDISNYVMLEVGQPLHFYDADKLGDTLVVRQARNDEKLTTLDGQERTLNENDIVIANKNEAIGLAGVMGGLSTEVTEDTKNILIESAIFDAVKIRLTSKKVLRSEASNRFEKGLDPNRTYMAIERSCHLLEKLADAEIVSGLTIYDEAQKEDKKIDITFEKINQVLGIEVPREEVLGIFRRLGFKATTEGDVVSVLVPSRRLDISIKEDLIEEVGRIYGMDKIVAKPIVLPLKTGSYDKAKRSVRNKMVDLGLNETLSYALIPEKEVHKYTTDEFETVKILDPMTEERNALRYSLLPSLKMVYEYNKARNLKDVSIFEIGKSFYKKDGKYGEQLNLAVLMVGNYTLGLNKETVNFYTIKGIMEELLDHLGFHGNYSLVVEDIPTELHPGQSASIMISKEKVGIIGKVHPNVSKDDIYVLEVNLEKLLNDSVDSKPMKYKEISKFPSVVKDVAFVMNQELKSEVIEAEIKKAGGKLLTGIEVFDVYTGENVGENEKSIAYKLTFTNPERTLSDEEVLAVFNKIIEHVSNTCKVSIRA
ncbi:MAG: phenylalanine--tRNA ligase subunit beta [Clostridia bacterium]|nr:phenylalanine--tRNA ligase subunit beta [Clostridia bacterium]